MCKFHCILLLTFLIIAARSHASDPLVAFTPGIREIAGDRVNVRARPGDNFEVVTQLEFGVKVDTLAQDGEWIAIVPPSNVLFFAHRDFVADGKVKVNELNVRSGASINFSPVGRIPRGTAIEVVEERGEWLAIRPPPGTQVWVHGSLLKPLPPPAPPPRRPDPPRVLPDPPEPRMIPRPAPVAEPPPVRVELPPAPPPIHQPAPPVAAPKPPEPIPPSDLQLVPLQGQGRLSVRSGIVQSYLLRAGTPSRFTLLIRVDGQEETVCYIKASDAELSRWVGRPVRISGRDYWVQGRKIPVMVPDSIEALPALP